MIQYWDVEQHWPGNGRIAGSALWSWPTHRVAHNGWERQFFFFFLRLYIVGVGHKPTQTKTSFRVFPWKTALWLRFWLSLRRTWNSSRRSLPTRTKGIRGRSCCSGPCGRLWRENSYFKVGQRDKVTQGSFGSMVDKQYLYLQLEGHHLDPPCR